MEDLRKQTPEGEPTEQAAPTEQADQTPEAPTPPAPREDGGSAFFDYSADPAALAPRPEEDRDPNAGKSLATISMILSIVALCGCGSLGFPLAIAAIVLAALSRKRARAWSSMSVTGLVVGILGVLYSLLAVVLVVFVLLVEGAYYDDPYVYVDYTTDAVLPSILALVRLR